MRLMVLFLGIVFIGFGSGSSQAEDCPLLRVFSGERKMMRDDRYFYIIDSESRDLLARLAEARWGYDVQTPEGELLGSVYIQVADPSLPKGTYGVSSSFGSCAPDVDLLLRKKRDSVNVTFKRKQIGRVKDISPDFLP